MAGVNLHQGWGYPVINLGDGRKALVVNREKVEFTKVCKTTKGIQIKTACGTKKTGVIKGNTFTVIG